MAKRKQRVVGHARNLAEARAKVPSLHSSSQLPSEMGGSASGEAVPMTIVVGGEGDAARITGLLVHPFMDEGVFLGAIPDTPADKWIRAEGTGPISEASGMRPATQEEFDAFIGEHSHLTLAPGLRPYGVLDARHVGAARRGSA